MTQPEKLLETALGHLDSLVRLYEEEHPENCLDASLYNKAVRSARAFYANYWHMRTTVTDEPGLTDDEQAAQGERCGCKGVDDYCPCQNLPDRTTREARAKRLRK